MPPRPGPGSAFGAINGISSAGKMTNGRKHIPVLVVEDVAAVHYRLANTSNRITISTTSFEKQVGRGAHSDRNRAHRIKRGAR